MVRKAPGDVCVWPGSIEFDRAGQAWVALYIQHEDNTSDVGFCVWDGTGWSEASQVNEPDSSEMDFTPSIASGGGETWYVWHGGPFDWTSFTVYACRWDSAAGFWLPEMPVSPPDGRHHWLCDIGVDSRGTPHVVWCTTELLTVFYSYHTGDSWSTPVPVNDTTRVTASPRAAPHIVVDSEDKLYLSFTGARAGATTRDIFYSHNDGTGWSEPGMVTQDSSYQEWYSAIAARSPDDVWVVWDRQGEGPDQFRVYSSHWDGIGWSPEERLDNDSAYNDVSAAICLDRLGLPWVVWSGMTYGANQVDDIFYNYIGDVGMQEAPLHAPVRRRLDLTARSPTVGQQLSLRYTLPASSRVALDVYDRLGRRVCRLTRELQPAGQYSEVLGLSQNHEYTFPPGVYFCRLAAVGIEETCSFVLLTR